MKLNSQIKKLCENNILIVNMVKGSIAVKMKDGESYIGFDLAGFAKEHFSEDKSLAEQTAATLHFVEDTKKMLEEHAAVDEEDVDLVMSIICLIFATTCGVTPPYSFPVDSEEE